MPVQALDPLREGSGVMRVRRWMTTNPVTVTPQTSVLNARRLLRLHRVRHLPVVVNGDQLVGIVSDRDIQLRDDRIILALSALQSDLLAGRYRCIDTIMSTPVRTVRPEEPVGVAAKLMLRWQVNSLPVTEHRRLVGIITTADCLRALLAELDQNRGRQPASTVLADDPDWYKLTPMPPGDDRPGRPTPAPERAPAKAIQEPPTTVVDAVLPIDIDAVMGAPPDKEAVGIAG